MGITVGIDTGGTFTDLVAVNEATGRWHVAKVPSNPQNPVSAIDASLHAAGFDPAHVSFVVVGTTIGINAVLTRRGARVVYLTTEGFEDILHIQRITRKGTWREQTPAVWETVVTPCDCCGRVVAKRLWIVEVDGGERRFCSPACEDLYRDYVLPRKTADR